VKVFPIQATKAYRWTGAQAGPSLKLSTRWRCHIHKYAPWKL